jgi:hypothetical protein
MLGVLESTDRYWANLQERLKVGECAEQRLGGARRWRRLQGAVVKSALLAGSRPRRAVPAESGARLAGATALATLGW